MLKVCSLMYAVNKTKKTEADCSVYKIEPTEIRRHTNKNGLLLFITQK